MKVKDMWVHPFHICALAPSLSHVGPAFFSEPGNERFSKKLSGQFPLESEACCCTLRFCHRLLIRAQAWRRGRNKTSPAEHLCNVKQDLSMAWVSVSLKCQDGTSQVGLYVKNTHSQGPPRTHGVTVSGAGALESVFLTSCSGDSAEPSRCANCSTARFLKLLPASHFMCRRNLRK